MKNSCINSFKLLLNLALALLLLLCVFILGCFVYVKIVAGNTGQVISTDYNYNHKCYAVTYISEDIPKIIPNTSISRPNLYLQNLLQTLHNLAGNPIFYRVYKSNGELVASTEWHLFETTAILDGKLEWSGDKEVVYGAQHGYTGMRVPECS